MYSVKSFNEYECRDIKQIFVLWTSWTDARITFVIACVVCAFSSVYKRSIEYPYTPFGQIKKRVSSVG